MAQYITKPEPHGVLLCRPGVADMYLPYAEYKQLRQLPADSTAEFIYTHQQVHQVVQGIDPQAHFLPVRTPENTIVLKPGTTHVLKNGKKACIESVNTTYAVLVYSIHGYEGYEQCTVQEFLDRIQP